MAGKALAGWLAPGALVLLPAAAFAEVATIVTIDPGQEIGGTLAATTAGDSLNVIAVLLNANSGASLANANGNLLELDIAVGADLLFDAALADSDIFAVARGNTSSSLLGQLPGAPVGGAVAGAGLLTGVALLEANLVATASDNSIGLPLLVEAPAILDLDLTGAQVRADGSFNTTLASIELLPSAALRAPAGPASYVDSGTVLVELEASLSVAGSQVIAAFSSTPAGEQPSAAAYTSGNTIQLDLQASGDSFAAGTADLTDNAVLARANGNSNDGSILLRNAITGVGTGPGLFTGTALVLSQQNSDDIRDPDGDFRGQGVIALSVDNAILGSLATGAVGQATATLDSLTLTLDGNRLGAEATINAARGEIGFAPALSLRGSGVALDQGAGDASLLLQERLGLRDGLADYLVISRQSSNRREVVDPVLSAALQDGRITGQLTTPAAVARLALSDNTLDAVADGNRNEGLLGNRLDAAEGESASFVDATLAVLNWQWVSAPGFAASIAGPGTGIGATLTLLAPQADQVASLDLLNSRVSARVNGNSGTTLIDFAALELSLQLSTDGPAGAVANAGAVLSSFRGATNAGDTFGATAGGVAVSYQILDSAAASHSEQDFLAPGIAASVTDSALAATLTVAGARADESLTLALEASDNLVEARAAGNRYQALAQLEARALFSGSLGLLAVQIDNDQSVAATIANSGLGVTLDAAALEGANFAATVTVSGNSVLAVAGINSSTQGLALEAGQLIAAGWSSLHDPNDPVQGQGGVIQGYQFNSFRVTRHNATANAAIALLNDQTADEGDGVATLTNSGIAVTVVEEPGEVLEHTTLELSGNRVVAQARLNDTINSIVLDIATLAGLDPVADPGPLAGIVNAQGSGQGFPADPQQPDLPERASEATSHATDSGITLSLPAMAAASVEIQSNLLGATAAANVAANSVALSAVSLRAGIGEPPGVAILDNANGTDFDIAVLGSVFIANSQRNEYQLFGGGPGPTVSATVDGEAGIRVVSDGPLRDSLVTISDNAVIGEARANVAQNVITLQAVMLEASAQIVSRQGNGGDVTATLNGGAIAVELNAGAGLDAAESATIVIEGNQISSLALGNAVLNVIDAQAIGRFEGFDGSPATVAEDLPATGGETTVNADYTILNRQVNAGTAEQPLQISSTVEGGQLSVTLDGNHDATTVIVRDNLVSAAAYGNVATNSVTLRATAGSLPSSAVVNQQNNSHANISASVSGGGINLNLAGSGAGGGLVGGPNSVTASAVGNAATNTMAARSGGTNGID